MIRKAWGFINRKGGTVIIDGFSRDKNGDALVVHHVAGAKKGGSSVLRITQNGERYFLCRKQRVYLADCVRV